MKTVVLSTRETVQMKTLLQSRIEELARSNQECRKTYEECTDEDLKHVLAILIECNLDEMNDCNSILSKITF